MKGYGQFCPVAKAAELVAERWTPLVLREVLMGCHTFNDIQRGVPLMSRSLLAKRLKELEKAQVLEKQGVEYHLTAAGKELEPIIIGLGQWGQRWARSTFGPDDLDPRLLLWDMRRNIHVDLLPQERVVTEFHWSDVPQAALKRSWMIFERPDVDACYKDPGFGPDLLVRAKLRTMTMVWMGDMEMNDALRSDDIQIEGPRSLARQFPDWLALSSLAGIAPAKTPA